MLARDQETEAEVTKEDQKLINSFGKLNNKYHELETEKKLVQDQLINIQDAQSDLMLADDDIPVKYQLGECYMQVDKTEVESLLEKEEQRINSELDRLNGLLSQTKGQMSDLKVKLYAKFGNAINLEED